MLKKIIGQIELDQFTFYVFKSPKSLRRSGDSGVDDNVITVAVSDFGDRIKMLSLVLY